MLELRQLSIGRCHLLSKTSYLHRVLSLPLSQLGRQLKDPLGGEFFPGVARSVS